MTKRHLLISALLMLMMVLFVIPGAQAAADCGAAPGPNVDWSNCTKSEDFTNADLSDMILRETDFSGSTFDNTDFSNSDLTNAIMGNMGNGSGLVGATIFHGARVEGLDMSANSSLIFADFTGAIGEPILPPVPPSIIFIRCPAGNDVNYITAFCTWTPAAVSLAGISGTLQTAHLPIYAVGMLGFISTLLLAGLWQKRAGKTRR